MACDEEREKRDRLKNEIGMEPDLENLGHAKDVFDKVKMFLLRQPGVTAVDVGFMIDESKDRFTKEIAVRVHVENKENSSYLQEQLGRTPFAELKFERLGIEVRRQPKDDKEKDDKEKDDKEKDDKEKTVFLRISDEAPWIPLDVIEARYLPSNGVTGICQVKQNNGELENEELLEHVRTRVFPLVGGISIGTQRGPAGTLGAVVWDRTDGTPCLLSNWHVLAGSPSVRRQEACFQPAFFDGGTPDDLVGRLKRWIFDRYGDAALAQIDSDRAYSAGEILGLWVPVAGTVEPWLGMPVRKWGRSTGFTEGFIDGLYFTTELEYSGLGVQRFEDQIHIAARYRGEEVSDLGDSGSIWVTKYVPYSTNPPKQEDDPNQAEDSAKKEAVSASAEGEASSSPGPPKTPETPTPNESDEHKTNGRVYYAVALHFAGDQPGTKSGEFAVASKLHVLAERLKFSFRPVFFPRSDLVIQQVGVSPRESVAPSSTSSTARGFGPFAEGHGNPAGGPQPKPDVEDPPP